MKLIQGRAREGLKIRRGESLGQLDLALGRRQQKTTAPPFRMRPSGRFCPSVRSWLQHIIRPLRIKPPDRSGEGKRTV
jgi:hypothetical protein